LSPGIENEKRKKGKNQEGRDIGYALASDSREGVNGLKAYITTAPDAITVFAFANANWSSHSKSDFPASDCQQGTRPS
jgi:hypothetical protein